MLILFIGFLICLGLLTFTDLFLVGIVGLMVHVLLWIVLIAAGIKLTIHLIRWLFR